VTCRNRLKPASRASRRTVAGPAWAPSATPPGWARALLRVNDPSAYLAAREMLIENDTLLDPGRRQLILDGTRADLTKLEFDVLQYLYEREGRVVGRAALLRDVWGYDWSGGSNVVEVVISALRRKLGDCAGSLQTVRGAGTASSPRPEPGQAATTIGLGCGQRCPRRRSTYGDLRALLTRDTSRPTSARRHG
jgi:hypothetical protein